MYLNLGGYFSFCTLILSICTLLSIWTFIFEVDFITWKKNKFRICLNFCNIFQAHLRIFILSYFKIHFHDVCKLEDRYRKILDDKFFSYTIILTERNKSSLLNHKSEKIEEIAQEEILYIKNIFLLNLAIDCGVRMKRITVLSLFFLI